MSVPKLVEAVDWNALLSRIGALEAGTAILLRDPDYDSDWFNLAQNANVNKAHGTGSTKLLVELHGRTSGGDISKFYGGWASGGTGGWWMTLTTTNININRGIADTRFYDLRVFCWKLT